MCTPVGIRAVPVLPLASRFEYIDLFTFPGVFWACHVPLSNLLLHVWGSGPHLIRVFWCQCTPQTASRSVQPFCTAQDRDRPTDRPTDHATPSVTILRYTTSV